MTESSSSAASSKASNALSKIYDPSGTEKRWQLAWEKTGAFHPQPNAQGEPFSVVIPPPNVTGSLHMGHAFNTALIDTIIRFQRLKGKNVLCLPGTDHASIAVQTILERQIKKEGKDIDQIGREVFLERAWNWKAESGGKIVDQLRRLGYSVDWKRERFTLDEDMSKAVVEGFIRLYNQGLIYRGEYLVNWCPASCSAVSDLEVEMKEVDGHLWHFLYPLSDGPDNAGNTHIEVATTRPETMLGDVAVAVNPTDKRYSFLIGKKVNLPLTDRQIPVIADDHVDETFGTGCVKVTPAHDPNDFAIAQRHNLPQINIMNKDGTMNENTGSFEGLDRFDARRAVVDNLTNQGLLSKVEPHRHSVPYSDRGKVPIEPLLSTQWFIRMEPMAARCKAHLAKGEPSFIPNRWEKVYSDWLTDIRDWCISRQLWWGHRIPVWFVISETEGELKDNTPYVVASSKEDAWMQARNKYGELAEIEQDEDVLDTWFSSGLWPFSTLGWPDETNPDLGKWFPTSALITGFDIIFFWVARMTMMSGTFTGKMPFKDVYIHGLVRDENNKKMSKSAGNGIDPLLLIDRYGADALRFALVREVAGSGQDIRLDFDREKCTSLTVEASRNFANKLWNATRFALMNLPEGISMEIKEIDCKNLQPADYWILSRLERVKSQTSNLYSSYALGEAAKALYEFAWNDFCDWYLELIKRRFNKEVESHADSNLADKKIAQTVLKKVLNELLIMLHPLIPHLTEELWHALTGSSEDTFLALQLWPKQDERYIDQDLEESFSSLFSSIRLVRNLRAIAGLKPSQSAPVRFITTNKRLMNVLKESEEDIKALTRADILEVCDTSSALTKTKVRAIAGVSGELEVLLPIEGLVDVDALCERLKKDLIKAEKEIETLSRRLVNSDFVKKAPSKIVNECKEKLSEAETQADLSRKRLSDLM